MKFSLNIAQFVIILGCVATSVVGSTQLREAVDKNDFTTIRALCEENKSACKKELEYVVEAKPHDSVFEFTKEAGLWRADVLSVLYKNGSKEAFAKFSDDDFPMAAFDFAASVLPVCSPEDLFTVLDKITTPEMQDDMIWGVVMQIFDAERVDCIDPLLTGLENRSFLSGNLKNMVIKHTFIKSASRNLETWAKRFYNHPAVTPSAYASGLTLCNFWHHEELLFWWLLARADQDDLNALKPKYDYQRAAPVSMMLSIKPWSQPSLVEADIVVSFKKLEILVIVLCHPNPKIIV